VSAASQRGMSDSEYEAALVEAVGEFYDDPFGFTMWAYEWGAGELKEFPNGPDDWQAAQMIRVGEKIRANPTDYAIREAIASGHGIGKTAEVAWLVNWAMATRPHLSGVVTANTTNQLSTKTWREIALWQKRSLVGHWFVWSATRFYHKEHPETWFVAAVPNTEHNSEAFAGLHATHSMIIYDEASGIPDKIWEVTEGAMTDPRAMWFVYGNPTRNTGRFKDCFERDKMRWTTRHIDSRTCQMTNKKELQEWLDTYGEDSDFFRVRVRGQFPKLAVTQFIATDIVDAGMRFEIELEAYFAMPIVLGVDVARYGDDKTVVSIRQGRKLLTQLKWRELNTMEVAERVATLMREFKPQATFVDAVGIGAGVVDRLRQLNYEVIEVNAGSKAMDNETYYNKRAEMWGRMREWIRDGADIPQDQDLRDALTGIEFSFDDKERIRLERKQDMKKRGQESPDEGDSLAHTFAEILGDFSINYFEPDDQFEPEEYEI